MTVHRPRIVTPIAVGDNVVWVSGVTPGAGLSVHSGDTVIGQLHAAEPLVPVTVQPVAGPVHAVASLPGESATGLPVEPVRDPGDAPGFPPASITEIGLDFGPFHVPTTETPEGVDGGFDVPLRALLYLQLGGGGPLRRPLVVIAHGYWKDVEEDPTSLRGYGWLARHLARWGMTVCSIDLSEVNRETTSPFEELQQWSRGEVILAVIDRLVTFTHTYRFVDRDRIGLVGHSMGGEGVVLAQALNVRRHQRFGVRGVVSLAPTNYRPDVACTHAAYLQLHGSLDYLLDGPWVVGAWPRFGGFRLYDRAWRPRSLAWIEGARHEGWNSIWFDSPNTVESPADGLPELTAAEQQTVGRALVTAFFLDTLFDRQVYRGYLAGPARPKSLGSARVFLQHQSASVVVVDDFGDGDGQTGATAEQPLDKTVNRRGQPVNATGVDRWNDVEHRSVPHSVHDTRGTDLAWLAAGGRYESGLGLLSAAETDTLSLRVAQHYAERVAGVPDETWNPIGLRSDVFVELDDGAQRARVRLGVAGSVPYPLLGREIYSVFRTVRLPLDAFTATNPALNLRGLRQVRLLLTLRATGRILVDDVEFDLPLITAASRISMLRVHDRGGFGPNDDHLEGEVVVQVDARPGESFGFHLRPDGRLSSARGMLALLRGALVAGTPVRLEYLPAGRTVRDIVAVRRTL